MHIKVTVYSKCYFDAFSLSRLERESAQKCYKWSKELAGIIMTGPWEAKSIIKDSQAARKNSSEPDTIYRAQNGLEMPQKDELQLSGK